jgi:ketosteroid isomerase-like protein
VVLRGNEWFRDHGEFPAHLTDPDFVWDMSHFRGWPERPTYEGMDGVKTFLAEWTSTWDQWRVEIQTMHDAGDKVVAIARQHGRSKMIGMQVEMVMAMVWTVRNGKATRMDMYSDPGEALRAAGLAD